MVGLTGMLIDFGVTYVLKEFTNLHKYLANATGFVLAASNNFYWNKVWTFQDTNPDVSQQFLSFVVVSIVGLGINTIVIMLLETKFKMKFYLAKVLAIIVVVIWNFIMNYLYTF